MLFVVWSVDGCLCCLVESGHVTVIKQQRDDLRRWGARVEAEWGVFFSSVLDMARTTAHKF